MTKSPSQRVCQNLPLERERLADGSAAKRLADEIPIVLGANPAAASRHSHSAKTRSGNVRLTARGDIIATSLRCSRSAVKIRSACSIASVVSTVV